MNPGRHGLCPQERSVGGPGFVRGAGGPRRSIRTRGLDAGVYRGYEEIRGFMERFLAAWDEVRIAIVDGPVEVEDGVLITENVAYLRGRDGIDVEARSAWLTTIRDGEQTSLTMYQTKREALEAAGLRE